MKPRIHVFDGAWICYSKFFGILGHALTARGFGDTPAAAYEDWSNHWGIKK